jgi:Tfp pilus assembly protein PilF
MTLIGVSTLYSAELSKEGLATQIEVGNSYLQKKDYGEAERIFKSLLKSNPNDFASYAAIAVYYMQIGASEKAIAHYKKALELNPSSLESRIGLAMTYFVDKQKEQGLAEFMKVVEQDNSPKTLAYIGDILVLINEKEYAMKCYQKLKGWDDELARELLLKIEGMSNGQDK